MKTEALREFDESKMKLPFSLGEACERMYQQMWFDSTPIKYIYKDVEIIMRKFRDS